MRFLAVAFVLVSTSCFAQESAQYRACNEKAKVQFEINACASEEAARVDAELNSVYRTLLQTVKQPEYAEKIKVAERAWIAYRDAYIQAMYPASDKQAEYGSIFPSEVSNLRVRLTHRQIVALREMIEQYKGT
jgi:uncharacterized protein YecT (DUF1311 family)